MDEYKVKRKPNPRCTASWISRICLCWFFPFLNPGHEIYLDNSNIPDPVESDTSSVLADRLQRNWTNEVTRAKLSDRPPSLLRTIMVTFASKLLFSYSLHTISYLYIKMTNPLCLGYLIRYFDGDPDISSRNAQLVAGLFFFNTTLFIILHHAAFYFLYQVGMQIRIACCTLIFNKCLHLGNNNKQNISPGKIVNLLSNDVNKFERSFHYLVYLFLGPVQVIIIAIILWKYYLGLWGLIPPLFTLLCLPGLVFTGKLFKPLRASIAERADKRISKMNEILNGMRVIKMYAWESSFAKLIAAARRSEVQKIRVFSLLLAATEAFFMAFPKIALLLMLIPFIVFDRNEVTADKLFVTVTYIYALRTSAIENTLLVIIPMAEALISMERIQRFLLQDNLPDYRHRSSMGSKYGKKTNNEHKDKNNEVEENNVNRNLVSSNVFSGQEGNLENTKMKIESSFIKVGEKCETKEVSEDFSDLISSEVNQTAVDCVSLGNVSACWRDDNDPVLQEVTCNVKPKQLVAIIGRVASGKTSLLQTIIGDLTPFKGKVTVKGRIAYVPQEPWIFSASLKQNIIFGTPYDERRFKNAIHVCELEEDLQQLPQGEESLVGERGVTLSGGQKARVALARAVYSDADVYVLDDPLSAVDARTSRRLYQQCILGYLRDKAKILVTHQLQHLQEADHILMIEKGRIIEEGTYEELRRSEAKFAALLASENKKQRKTEEKTRTYVQEHSKVTLEAESNECGSVSWRVYYEYYTSGFGVFGFNVMLLLCLASHGLFTFSDWWLAYWSSKVTHLKTEGLEDQEYYSKSYAESLWCFEIYTVQVVGLMAFTLGFCMFYLRLCINSSEHLHNQMFNRIFRSPIRFFDVNPIGRVLNRFSRDLGYIDTDLPLLSLKCISTMLWSLGVVILVGVVNPWVLIPTAIIGVVLASFTGMYLKSIRAIRRLEGISRSPVFSHVSASLQGRTTIRAFDMQRVIQQEFNSFQDTHTSTFDLYISGIRLTSILMEIAVLVYIGCVIVTFFMFEDTFDGSGIGLAMSQIFHIPAIVQFGFRQFAETENLMTSAERIMYYGKLPQEASAETEPDKQPASDWPDKGRLTATGLNLSYDETDSLALKQVSFEIESKEKVGVVGRTGAGKSSLVAALFRMAEPQGQVYVDGINTSDLGLHDLRANISIIPQDPFLFHGTVRGNLDPFDSYTDETIWKALKQANLNSAIIDMKQGLDAVIEEGGSNLSAGQKQLMCLARALLKRNKILILDEATANVDPITDDFIQSTIREEFEECTVLTIAHRIHTVIDSDRILVLDKGMVKEFDCPWTLLQNTTGLFFKMVENTGSSTSSKLTEEAKQVHLTKHCNLDCFRSKKT